MWSCGLRASHPVRARPPPEFFEKIRVSDAFGVIKCKFLIKVRRAGACGVKRLTEPPFCVARGRGGAVATANLPRHRVERGFSLRAGASPAPRSCFLVSRPCFTLLAIGLERQPRARARLGQIEPLVFLLAIPARSRARACSGPCATWRA